MQARKLPVFCNIHGSACIKVKVKGPPSLLMVHYVRATGRHLPYGITRRYLPVVMMGDISFLSFCCFFLITETLQVAVSVYINYSFFQTFKNPTANRESQISSVLTAVNTNGVCGLKE